MTSPEANTAQIPHDLSHTDRAPIVGSAGLSERVDAELRRLAEARLAELPPGQTLQATVLVNEAWARLGDGSGTPACSRGDFLRAAAHSLRSLLVDRARGQRGVGSAPALLPGAEAHVDRLDVLALDRALTVLAAESARPARIAELRFFAGSTIAELAQLEGIDPRAIDRDLLFARTWLRRRL
ncbi:MAG: ECF-type sigma factor [Planctomycetota bacterium]